jgi:hypothetical protein
MVTHAMRIHFVRRRVRVVHADAIERLGAWCAVLCRGHAECEKLLDAVGQHRPHCCKREQLRRSIRRTGIHLHVVIVRRGRVCGDPVESAVRSILPATLAAGSVAGGHASRCRGG